MRKVFGVLAVASAFVAAPVLAQDFDPVGEYEFETVVDGQTVGGTMTITGEPGAYTGVIIAEGQPEMPLSSVETEGSLVTILAEIPEAGELIIEVEFEGDEFSGSWALGFDGGELIGRKIS